MGGASSWSWWLFIFYFPYFVCVAKCGSIVARLPGFRGLLPFYLETGYINVDQENGVEMFYYFVQSERNRSDDPLLVWLPGGPGCSALHCLTFQIGPLEFVKQPYDGSLPELVYHEYSWTKVANILYLDSPVGSGFSYSSNPKGYETGDKIACMQIHKFIRKWLEEHSQYLLHDLYVGGHSYAGKLTPFVAELIAEGIEAGTEPPINFKGYLIGNPATGEIYDSKYRPAFAHGMGIISDTLYESTRKNCQGDDYETLTDNLCTEALSVVYEALSETNKFHVLEPVCDKESMSSTKYTVENRRILSEEEQLGSFKCRDDTYSLGYYWANDDLTREALRITKGTVEEWIRCRMNLPFAYDLSGTVRYHRNVTTRGYRALVYSGDHDRLLPFLGTQAWLRSLNFSIVDDWRAWHLSGQAAGFTISYTNNLTYATVKGAGHIAPEYKPKESFAMVQRWLSHQSL